MFDTKEYAILVYSTTTGFFTSGINDLISKNCDMNPYRKIVVAVFVTTASIILHMNHEKRKKNMEAKK